MYEPTTWRDGDVITADKLNKLEQGVQDAQEGQPYVLPEAKPDTLGGVKQAAAVSDAAAAPTQEEFNGLLNSLRAAGILASS